MKPSRRKVGRPKSGKKAHCIRIKPATYTELVRAGKAAGYARVGDWLDRLPFVGAAPVTSYNEMSSDELAHAFRMACNVAGKSLLELCEVIDYDPAVGKSGLHAFRKLNKQYQQLLTLARSVGINNK